MKHTCHHFLRNLMKPSVPTTAGPNIVHFFIMSKCSTYSERCPPLWKRRSLRSYQSPELTCPPGQPSSSCSGTLGRPAQLLSGCTTLGQLQKSVWTTSSLITSSPAQLHQRHGQSRCYTLMNIRAYALHGHLSCDNLVAIQTASSSWPISLQPQGGRVHQQQQVEQHQQLLRVR
jgi:hypothetical protein